MPRKNQRKRANILGERTTMAEREAKAAKSGKKTGRFQQTGRLEKDAKQLVKQGRKASIMTKAKTPKARKKAVLARKKK